MRAMNIPDSCGDNQLPSLVKVVSIAQSSTLDACGGSTSTTIKVSPVVPKALALNVPVNPEGNWAAF
jgi:hypothetical protein